MFDRNRVRDNLMRAARGAVSVHVIDELVELIALAHHEHEAFMARMRADFNAEVAAIRREFAALRDAMAHARP
jgi:hypothetical protein